MNAGPRVVAWTALRRRPLALFVVLVYVLAAIVAGLAHRPALTTAPPLALDLAAYVLPDGTRPALCGTGSGHDAESGPCDACRLVAAPGLPPPDGPSLPVPSATPAAVSRAATSTPVRATRTRPWPRGPPARAPTARAPRPRRGLVVCGARARRTDRT